MLKLNLGYWQLACAKDVMLKSWIKVKSSNCTMAKALRKEWKKVKEFIKNLCTSYKEYKYKLFINKQKFILTFNTNDLDEIVAKCLEKIALIKGKNFIYKISNDFYSRYDKLLYKFKNKGSLTFYKDVFIIKLK